MDSYEPTENSQQKTILIVDDNKDMLQFVSSCMKEDYQVYTATDGAAALELLQREQIDLITHHPRETWQSTAGNLADANHRDSLCRRFHHSEEFHNELQGRIRHDSYRIPPEI